MVSRRDLKEVHENAVLKAFRQHLEMEGKSFNILDQPDPPEAIVEIDGTKTWIEITDAFLDQPHARGLTSGASDDVPHVRDDKRLIVEPDAIFRAQLHNVISKKYEKYTMQKVKNELGAGILLVGVFTPFNTANGIAEEEKINIASLIAKKDIAVFEKIYVYDGTGKREFHMLFDQT